MRISSFDSGQEDIVRRKSSGTRGETRIKFVEPELVAWKSGSRDGDSNQCETINEESQPRGDSGQVSQRMTPHAHPSLDLRGLRDKIPKEPTATVNFTERSSPFKSARQTGQKKSLKSPSRSQILSNQPLTDRYNLDSSKYLNQYMPRADSTSIRKSGSTGMLKKLPTEAMRIKKGLIGAGNLNLDKT
jgi:hypothetical protein